MTLQTALSERDAAKVKFDSLKPGGRKWREAEEDLNFWQSKVANLEALARR